MDEFPWGQLFTALAGLGGAIVGAVSGTWGTIWRERRQREYELDRVAADARHAALLVFSKSLLEADAGDSLEDHRVIREARLAFIATLRPGEGAAADYAKRAMDEVMAAPYGKKQKIASDRCDHLFAWLHGDANLS